MKRDVIYITIITVLLAATALFWYRSHEFSRRLNLIQKRIEESKKERAEKALYKAKVAIVIDDFGYNLNNIDDLWALEIPVTVSILPNLSYSTKIAQAAKEKDREVILHLPLEPYENENLEKGTIMADMTDKDILENLDRAISSVPNLKGVSNHMGSKATEDRRVMSVIFKRMKEKRLYFLDSLVTDKSVCKALSRQLGVKFASRSVFLDNESNVEYIKGQMEELAEQALATGWAIGIGHDRAPTLAAIKESAPELKKRGIKFVELSELVR